MSIQKLDKADTKKIQKNFRFPPDTFRDLKSVADKESISMTDIVVAATTAALEEYKQTNKLNLELAK